MACQDIQGFVEGMSYSEFLHDKKTTSAVIRQFEIIGEAAKNIPASIKKKYTKINWKDMAGMRDRLIHGIVTKESGEPPPCPLLQNKEGEFSLDL